MHTAQLLELQHEYGEALELVWHPFATTGVEFGRCDPVTGEIDVSALKPHWRRKNPYLLRMARLEAAHRSPPLPLNGPHDRKLDTTTALTGWLFVANECPDPRALLQYHRLAFDLVWGPGPAAASAAASAAAAAVSVSVSAASAAACQVDAGAQPIAPAVLGGIGSPATIAAAAAAAITGATGQAAEAAAIQARCFRYLNSDVGTSDLAAALAEARVRYGVFATTTLRLEPGAGARPETNEKALVGAEGGELFTFRSSVNLIRHRLSLGRPQPLLPPLPLLPAAASRHGPNSSGGRQAPRRIDVYVDIKSPYAFLAIEPTLALEEECVTSPAGAGAFGQRPP